jgi:hypothetical protein
VQRLVIDGRPTSQGFGVSRKHRDGMLEDALGAIGVSENQAALLDELERHRQRLREMPADAPALEQARVLLDLADVLLGLDRRREAWDTAFNTLGIFVQEEAWQEAVECCELLYQSDQPDSVAALGQGTWLAVTWPVSAGLTVAMLHHIVDDTPVESDGAAVAAAAAHYIAQLRAEGRDRENLEFLTGQVLVQVAKRHRNIEGEEMVRTWMQVLGLDEPATLLPMLSEVIDALVGDAWWFDRDEIRAKLPGN